MPFPARPIPEMSERDVARFWQKVDRSDVDGCWLWMAGTFGAGYGQFRLKGAPFAAHRVAFALAGGHLGEFDTIDHLCLTKRCVNVAHFDVCSLRENQRRAWAVQYWTHYNSAKTHCKRGHEFSAENTRTTQGRRVCRQCTRLRTKEQRVAA